MSIQEVPKSYKYICDGCGSVHLQENANGHYTNSTPPGWATVRINTYNAAPFFEKLLCEECGDTIHHLLENWKDIK